MATDRLCSGLRADQGMGLVCRRGGFWAVGAAAVELAVELEDWGGSLRVLAAEVAGMRMHLGTQEQSIRTNTTSTTRKGITNEEDLNVTLEALVPAPAEEGQ